jgi:SPP1 family predicted phage head-tail adaptor
MRAGALDRLLTLRRRMVQADALGEEVETFADLATVRASKTDISDAEKVRAQQVGAEITTRFQIRWSANWSDLNPKDRVACELREYEVVGVKEIGRREGIEITAAARADQNNLYT